MIATKITEYVWFGHRRDMRRVCRDSNEIKYEWLMNGKPVSEREKVHKGTKTSILSIANADIDMDGFTYSCQVIIGGYTYVSKPVTLKVNCPPESFYVDLYEFWVKCCQVQTIQRPHSRKGNVRHSIGKHLVRKVNNSTVQRQALTLASFTFVNFSFNVGKTTCTA